MADSRCKYYKQKKQVSYDNGVTWYDVIPYEYQKGELYETESQDCGYVPPPPQYKTISGSPYCNQFDKYVDVYSQVSYDGGISWHTTSSASTLVEVDSVDCGVKYRWQPSGTTCVGYDKWEQSIRQKSYDNGGTWIDVSPLETSATTLVEKNSEDCGYLPTQERWIKTSDTLCVEYFKFKAKYSDGTSYTIDCTSTGSTLTSADTRVDSASYSAMTEAYIGSCVTTLASNCFYGCPASSITISDSLTTIGSSAFSWCTKVNSLIIPDSVTSIEKYAFNYCESFTSVGPKGSGASVEIPHGISTLNEGLFRWCGGLTNVVIPDYVTNIGTHTTYDGTDGVFTNCENLTAVTIPNSVTFIGAWSFFDCGFTTITIPNSVNTIGEASFCNCSNLQRIIIGSGVNYIAVGAFQHNRNLIDATFLSIVPPTLPPDLRDDYIFHWCENLQKIYVPAESVSAYQSASGWSIYASKIYPIP